MTRPLPGTADVLIVGAGIMGASIAFHLARRGAGRVIVVEKARVGQGGSGRSSALIRMHYSFPPEVQLAVRSLEIFRNWREVVGRPGDYHRTGFVRIVPGSETDRLRANVAMQQALGVNARVISREELRELEPDWVVDDVEAAAYEPDSGYGDGFAAAYDLLDVARESGVEYMPQTPAISIATAGDGSDGPSRVRGLVTAHGTIEAPVVLVATGPWTRPLLLTAGVDVPIETEFHQVAILKNPRGLTGGGSACIDSNLGLYFRSEGRDLTLVGTFYGPRPADPDRCDQAASRETLAQETAGIVRRIPALEDAGLVRGIAGVYDMTPDARPLLGPLPGIEGLYVAAGFSGMGFKIAPAVGLVMAELLLDGRTRDIDIAPFRPSRFAEGRPIKAEHEYEDD